MAYIGTPPNQQLRKITSQSFNGDGSTTVFTLNRSVDNSESLEVFVDNVQQEPGTTKSYTAAGTSLTFSEAPQTGTGNVYVIYRGVAEVTTRLEHDPNQALQATTGTFTGNVDINGNELILDADADSKIEASTDDTINIISGGTTIATATSGGLKTPKNCTATVSAPASGSLVLSGIPNWANKITLVTDGLSFDTTNGQVRIRVTVGGSAVTTAVYKYNEFRTLDTLGADIEDNGSGASYIETNGFNNVNNSHDYMFTFYRVDDYVYKFHGNQFNQYFSAYAFIFAGTITTTAAIDGFDIVTATGNFDAGKARAFWE